MAKEKSKIPQKDLPGMPEPSKLGKAAAEYLQLKEERDALKGTIETKGRELVELMLAEGKRDLKIEGRTISIVEKNGFKVTVKKVGS